jgi:hypothetical protein
MPGVQNIETTVCENNRFPWMPVPQLSRHGSIQNLRHPDHRFFCVAVAGYPTKSTHFP